MIDGLVVLFIDNYTDVDLSRRVLKVLKKLNEHFGEIVGEQFFANLRLPKALVDYLE